MGLQSKSKYRASRRKFGQTCGRYSYSARKKENFESQKVKKGEMIMQVKHHLKFPSYQLVRKRS